MDTSKIRNFCIIAHIDHGKSTLADRMMELTGTVDQREMKSQLLDSMDLEREKGITIKLAPVRMSYRGHELNLIDTPGHVDFSYEVSRSLAAVEGAILVVDATQGIQAQTLSNVYLALEQDLAIIPVLNKIDLPAAEPAKVAREIINLLGCSESDIINISAKTGAGVPAVLDAVLERVPQPQAHPQPDKSAAPDSAATPKAPDSAAPIANHPQPEARALIFDSYFDDYRGVVLYVRVFDGTIPKGANIKMLAAHSSGIALEVGALTPKLHPAPALTTGQIGYIVTNLHSTSEAKVGDTLTLTSAPAATPLPGYKDINPFVYAGFFPVSNDDYKDLKDAVERLSLSDSALRFDPENSPVLGFGLRIGFLGLLHLDIIRERLEREFGLDLVVTNPSTDYHVLLTDGEELDIKSATDLPDVSKISEIREPWIRGEIVVPSTYVGAVLELIVKRRGRQSNISYLDDRAIISFEAPMANLLTDFYDQLKSNTSGYGSFNYELADYRAEDLVRVDFYVAGELVSALSVMAHRSEADALGREVTKKLKAAIPRQAFEVALQAAIGSRFIARETIGAYRKDVLTKIHTGDRDRKAKLLSKQKRGKARMKRFGRVDIPSEAFTVMLRRD
jgi:GTP-binding protein LepA